MNEVNIIDDLLSPVSKWANKTLFDEQFDRTISQRFEDETGIPKIVLEIGVGVTGAILLKKWLDSRD